jgi:uncharacterized Zn finger protein
MQKTWWGEAFVESLTSFIDHGRLSRGRSYRTDRRVIMSLEKDTDFRKVFIPRC